MNVAAGPLLPLMDEDQTAPLWHLTIPEVKDVIVGELAECGEWIVANIQTGSIWPVNAQKVQYRGETLWIVPVMKKFYPAVAMKVPQGKSRIECEQLVMRFISTLSWVESRGFIVEGLGGGSLPAPMARDKEQGFAICEEFDLSYFPEPDNEKALLALALMREGRGLNHPTYAFLSFFRILEVAFPNSTARTKWMNDSVGSIQGHLVAEALRELYTKGIADIGAHLYESGRCAIAHAAKSPVIDPDDPSDTRRLQSELPIMTALAQKAIEEALGIETSQTVHRKHLYELAGFKEILGSEIVGQLVRGERITEERMVEIPDISVRIRKRDPYKPLSNLSVKEIGQNSKLFYIRFESKSGDVKIRLQLDFGAERLDFSLGRDLFARDTGSAEAADNMAEVSRFSSEYFGNGQLHILNAHTGALIARKDAFVPLNVYLDSETAEADIAHWKFLAEQRRELDRRYAEEMKRLSVAYDVRMS
jgi:Methylamine utilization protein MauJ